MDFRDGDAARDRRRERNEDGQTGEARKFSEIFQHEIQFKGGFIAGKVRKRGGKFNLQFFSRLI